MEMEDREKPGEALTVEYRVSLSSSRGKAGPTPPKS
jgi:hypothetical protein